MSKSNKLPRRGWFGPRWDVGPATGEAHCLHSEVWDDGVMERQENLLLPSFTVLCCRQGCLAKRIRCRRTPPDHTKTRAEMPWGLWDYTWTDYWSGP